MGSLFYIQKSFTLMTRIPPIFARASFFFMTTSAFGREQLLCQTFLFPNAIRQDNGRSFPIQQPKATGKGAARCSTIG